jgi:hypothetical protein
MLALKPIFAVDIESDGALNEGVFKMGNLRNLLIVGSFTIGTASSATNAQSVSCGAQIKEMQLTPLQQPSKCRVSLTD